MTREEAIEIIQKLIGRFKPDSRTYKALDMAIQALEQEPTFDDECQKDMDEAWEQIQKKRKRIPVTLDLTPCEDAISREAVKKWVCKTCPDDAECQRGCDVIKGIDALPSVTQNSGKWRRVSIEKYIQHAMAYYECSECGGQTIGEPKYCPNCGSYNGGVNNGNE